MSNSSSRRPNRKRGRPKRRAPQTEDAVITIERLGAQGDGIGVHAGKPVYAPGLLPGEEARVRLTGRRGDGRMAEVVEITTPAATRATPPCPHAESCGGCTVQHMADDAYVEWKEGLLDQALSARALQPETCLPMRRITEGRRRLRFAAIGRAGGVVFGFNARASNQIIQIERCMAAADPLADLPKTLRPTLNALLLPGEAADVEAWVSRAGLAVLLIRERPLDLDERQAVAAFAEAQDIARFAWMAADGGFAESVAERRPPVLRIGAATVAPPPGAFFQPTAAGEQAMADFAAKHVAGAERLMDLYCGWGAFALRLGGEGVHVAAYEGDAAMISALQRAVGQAGLGGFITGAVRDLARRPLMGDELEGLDAIILDPPRAGASSQIAAITAQGVKNGPDRIVYLSCNPAALARDGRVLVDAGFRFVTAEPIDQFRWTPHLEVATYFERS